MSSYLAVNREYGFGTILMVNMAGVAVQCPSVAMMQDLLPLAAG